MQRLKKGDEVIVIAGKDKGKRGEIARLVLKNGRQKLIVDGINVAKKHVKPNPQVNEVGGVVSREMPIDASNVMLFNPKIARGDRVGFRLHEGKKVRYFKSNGEVV